MAGGDINGSKCPPLEGLVYVKGQEVELPYACALGPVLLEVFATWCHVCPRGFPATTQLQQRYAWQGLRVVAVCMDGSVEVVREYVRQHDGEMQFAVAADTQGAAAALMRAAGVREVPHAFLLDTQGVIRAHANPMRLSFKMDVSAVMRDHTAQPPFGLPPVPTGPSAAQVASKPGTSLPTPGTPGSAGPATPMAPAQRSSSGVVASGGRQASWGEEGQQEWPVLSTRLPSSDLHGHSG